MRLILLFVSLVFCLTSAANAYGPIGHQIVGEVADKLLADKPAGEKVRALLDGLSLQKAAVIPDEIKGWDKNGPDAPGIFHYSSRPRIDAQLVDYWKANPPSQDHNSPVPSHHWFHYTDVPVFRVEKYADGHAGRSQWDIVHAMRYCVGVLKGEVPEDNERKVTKPIAIILLAHFVGDIHQPLHVGAEYFSDAGQPVDPDQDKSALEDQGGNSITLRHSPAEAQKIGANTSKLHGFWDNNAVNLNLPQLPKEMPKEERRARTDEARDALVSEFVRQEPAKWRLADNVPVASWPEAWANDILPVAREAHARLRFTNVHAEEDRNGGEVAIGSAEEQPPADHVEYEEWAARVVHDEMHTAGWRLAALLEKALQ
ncbi:MAG TPA: S1/P1 nuclease [Chthoniobacterales bacterium]